MCYITFDKIVKNQKTFVRELTKKYDKDLFLDKKIILLIKIFFYFWKDIKLQN